MKVEAKNTSNFSFVPYVLLVLRPFQTQNLSHLNKEANSTTTALSIASTQYPNL